MKIAIILLFLDSLNLSNLTNGLYFKQKDGWGSCGSNAFAHAIIAENNGTFTPSPLFLYAILRHFKGEGNIKMDDIANVLKDTGVCDYKLLSPNVLPDSIDASIIENAKNHRYYFSEIKLDTHAIKKKLRAKKFVVLGFSTTANFVSDPNFFQQKVLDIPPERYSRIRDGHAVCIIGYTPLGFLILDSLSNHPYYLMTFEYFKKYAFSAYYIKN